MEWEWPPRWLGTLSVARWPSYTLREARLAMRPQESDRPPTGPMSVTAIHDAFVALLGYPPREADHILLRKLGSTPGAVAEYIWDHHLGEPADPSREMVLAAVRLAASAHGCD